MAIEIEAVADVDVPLNEKAESCYQCGDVQELVNQVIESAEFAMKVRTDFRIRGM